MLDRLSRGPATVSQLAEPLPMSLPAVVQHLRVLEEGGLVSSIKVGRVRRCEIEPQTLRAATDWIEERKRSWEMRLDRLGEHLAKDKPSERSR